MFAYLRKCSYICITNVRQQTPSHLRVEVASEPGSPSLPRFALLLHPERVSLFRTAPLGMKNCDERDRYIYTLFREGHSFRDIALMPFHRPLSEKSIRNIVYNRDLSSLSESEQIILAIYHIKYERLKNRAEAIRQTYLSQPPARLSERRIREIVAVQRRLRISKSAPRIARLARKDPDTD